MSQAVPFLVQGKNIILVIDGKSHTISKDTHISYVKIIDALKAQDWDVLRDLVEPKNAIVNFGKGYVTIEGTKVFWKGQPFHNALADRMIEMYQDGFPIQPMVNFMENLMKNPSKQSVDQVYGFLEKNKLPITEDGHFLAYKRVSKNYLDIHSGTVDNSIGQKPKMDRNLVDDNPDSHCSSGLHFCSESYLGHFGHSSDPVMILKINPADVVSIPTDYNGAKGRCSEYEVIGQVTGDPGSAFSGIVDKMYSVKTPAEDAKPVTPDIDTTKAAWPFPTGDSMSVKPKSAKKAPAHATQQLYDLVRAREMETTVCYSMTLAEARDRVAKNVSQKKVQLKIVRAGTLIEVQ